MYMPIISDLNATSSGIMNTIRANASNGYQNSVPEVDNTTESIQRAGQIIMSYKPHKNEFVDALINRIAIVSITSRRYSNPLRWAKKGIMEYGDTEEEIFVNAVEGQPYNATGEALDMYKYYKGDIRSAFHSLNYQIYYPISINEKELRLAFTSRDGVTDLIARKVDSLYTGMNYDEFIMIKYIIARLALQGSIVNQTVQTGTTEEQLKNSTVNIKTIINNFQFMSSKYNFAGVATYTDPRYLHIITTASFDASLDVNVLASAFNLDKVEFLGRRSMVDSFSFNANEMQRLASLLKDDTSFVPFTTAENTLLESINAVAMDESFFRIWDVTPDQFTEQYDAVHLRWNEFLHTWRIFSASPFSNVVMFSSASPSITSVSVTGPSSAIPGQTVQFSATVVATDFGNKGVTWSVSPTTGATINNIGQVSFDDTASGTYTVTATSSVDSAKTGSASITVGNTVTIEENDTKKGK